MYCISSYSDATKKKCEWVYKIYHEWQIARNIKALGDVSLYHIGDLLDLSDEDLNFCLSHFIMEISKKSGENYPAETLYEIVIYIQLYLSMNGKVRKLLNQFNFGQIRNMLDNRMKKLCKMGIVKSCRQACIITQQEEELMWNMGILGGNAPKQLVKTLLYLFGLHFALCAGVEHKALHVGELSQLQVQTDNTCGLNYLQYTQDFAKNNRGGGC